MQNSYPSWHINPDLSVTYNKTTASLFLPQILFSKELHHDELLFYDPRRGFNYCRLNFNFSTRYVPGNARHFLYISGTRPLCLSTKATEEQRKAHIDIADLLIQWKQNGELIPGTPRKVQLNDSNDIEILLEKWFSSEYLPEIHNLINDFDLTPVTEEWLI